MKADLYWRVLNPSFFMTVQNFMNVVRFKLKSDFVDKYFEVIDKKVLSE